MMMKNFRLTELPTIKILFIIYNTVLMLIGFSYIGIGAWLVNVLFSKPKVDFIRLYYTSMGAIMIALGSLSTILAFYGYIATVKQKINTLIIYLVITVVLMLFGIAVGIIGLSYAGNTQNKVNEVVSISYFNSSLNTATVSDIQLNYGCCGVNSPSDWTSKLYSASLPASCCSPYTGLANCSSYYQQGCYTIVKNSVLIDMATAGGISLGIALPMLIGIALSIGLFIEYINEEEESLVKYQIAS